MTEEELEYIVDNVLEKLDIISDDEIEYKIEYDWLVDKWYNGFEENETEDRIKFDKLCKKFNIWNLYND